MWDQPTDGQAWDGRVVDGIILEDCDVVVLGVKDVFSKIKTANGEQQFKVYKRDDFFRNINPF